MRQTYAPSPDSGFAIFYILIAIVLFAALAYAFSSTLNSSVNNLTKEEARVYAQDTLSYASRLSRGIERVMVRGLCSENDISFYLASNALLAAYKHTPEVADYCKVFHSDGGSITWLTAPKNVNDGSDWVFTGGNRVDGIQSNAALSGNELIALLPYLDKNICMEINELVGIENTNDAPPVSSGEFRTLKYTGDFPTTTIIETTGGETSGHETGCFEATQIDGAAAAGTYHFYHVLVAR